MTLSVAAVLDARVRAALDAYRETHDFAHIEEAVRSLLVLRAFVNPATV